MAGAIINLIAHLDALFTPAFSSLSGSAQPHSLDRKGQTSIKSAASPLGVIMIAFTVNDD